MTCTQPTSKWTSEILVAGALAGLSMVEIYMYHHKKEQEEESKVQCCKVHSPEFEGYELRHDNYVFIWGSKDVTAIESHTGRKQWIIQDMLQLHQLLH